MTMTEDCNLAKRSTDFGRIAIMISRESLNNAHGNDTQKKVRKLYVHDLVHTR